VNFAAVQIVPHFKLTPLIQMYMTKQTTFGYVKIAMSLDTMTYDKKTKGNEMQNIDRQIKQQEMLIADAKTNHILHLILTLLTGGLWLVVWIIIGVINSNKREAAMKKIDLLLSSVEYKAEPKT